MLYRTGTQIAELREIGFPTEKAMQKFCEKNMETLLGVCYRLENNDISEQDLLMSPKSVSTIPFVYGRILSNYNGDDLEKKLEKAVRDIVIIVADAYKAAYANKQTTSVSNFFKSDTRYYNEILPGFSQGLGFLAGEDLKQCMGILKR